MFAILGSGFGLYGYLPALINLGERVVLPERYRDRFNSRPELAPFASQVQWSLTEEEALARADGVVLALRPSDQYEWVPRCLARSEISRLILEKPLAPAPDGAAFVLDKLIGSGKAFRIGYTFRYTDWALKLRGLVETKGVATFAIHWNFLAHHFRHDLYNWKRSTAQGGGAIRFYGIQVIALLAELGYREVTFSTGFGAEVEEIERWRATFTGNDLPICHVGIDTRSVSTEFRIGIDVDKGLGQDLVVQKDPFDSSYDEFALKGLDQRVDILTQLGQSLGQAETNIYDWYGATVVLWRAVESKLQFKPAAVK